MIAKAAETDDTELVRAQLDAVLPMFADGLKLDRAVLEQWADFDGGSGSSKERPDVERRSTSRCATVKVRGARTLSPSGLPPICLGASAAAWLQSRV